MPFWTQLKAALLTTILQMVLKKNFPLYFLAMNSKYQKFETVVLRFMVTAVFVDYNI